jgi:hypothetical protein
MDKVTPAVAKQIAQVALAFVRQWPGHASGSVTVVLSEDTLVVSRHGALSQAAAEVEPTAGPVVQVFPLAHSVSADTWSGKIQPDRTRLPGRRPAQPIQSAAGRGVHGGGPLAPQTFERGLPCPLA